MRYDELSALEATPPVEQVSFSGGSCNLYVRPKGKVFEVVARAGKVVSVFPITFATREAAVDECHVMAKAFKGVYP